MDHDLPDLVLLVGTLVVTTLAHLGNCPVDGADVVAATSDDFEPPILIIISAP